MKKADLLEKIKARKVRSREQISGALCLARSRKWKPLTLSFTSKDIELLNGLHKTYHVPRSVIVRTAVRKLDEMEEQLVRELISKVISEE